MKVRVVLPHHLKNLARVDGEVALSVEGPVSVQTILDALENAYPMLKGTVREHGTHKRRPRVRFYVCQEDISHAPPDTPLPEAITSGNEPLIIIGAISGG
ncbi:MAG TPA: MoaD/ThiS family protein [Xanthomonadales bacterium]|nr:MoaD/ThiS family protein [Xanthomonadales bacterium]